MECQTALAVPDEDNCMVVYSSIQCPEFAHNVIAKCLGVPEHNIRVITRRVGGGFGGKAIRAMPVREAYFSSSFSFLIYIQNTCSVTENSSLEWLLTVPHLG